MTTMYREVFSIIMPCYNAEAYISSSIKSVICQTYPHWCLYIIDDCSHDDSYRIIHEIVDSEPRIKYFRLPKNSGVAAARNVGIKAASGKYISFLDSDDMWAADKLERQFAVLETGYDIVCSNYKVFSTANNDEKFPDRVFPERFGYNDMLYGNKIGNLTGVYNCINLGKIYQERMGHEDYIMWLELIKIAKHAYCIQDSLAYYRLSHDTLSSNKWKASRWQWNIYRHHLGFGMIRSSLYWICYAYNALKR